jgi:hypothetical protein
MENNYQAQWISRQRMNEVRKGGLPGKSLFLNHLNGGIVVELAGSDLGDGAVLPPEEADYELQPAWISDPQSILRQARQLLGLGAVKPVVIGL